MTKITSLTTDQISLMYTVKDEWINNLTSLRLDRDKVKKGLDFLYSQAGLESPSHIVFVDSPLAMQLAYNILNDLNLKDYIKDSLNDCLSNSVKQSVSYSVNYSIWDSVGDPILNSVCDSVCDSVYDSVDTSLKDSVRDSIKNSIRDPVRDSVEHAVSYSVEHAVSYSVSRSIWVSVWDSIRDSLQEFVTKSVRDSINTSVRDSVRNSVRDSINTSVRDSVEEYVRKDVLKQKLKYQTMSNAGSILDWPVIAFYDYFQKIGVNLTSKFFTFRDFCCLSGAYDYLLYKDCAIVCQLPSNIEWQTINGIRVASSTTAPAIEWSDGFKVYQIRNVRVPEKVVMAPHTITIKEIQNEQNLEVRRIMIEQYGTEDYLRDIKATIIDFDIHGINNGARILLQDSNNDKWLLVTDGSTDRLYTMAVDPDSNFCSEGHSSLCGFNENLIKLEG